VFVIGKTKLEDILNDIFYITTYSDFDANYIDNMILFEKDFYMFKILAKLKEELERKNG
jgi:hypothetical protein